MSNRIEGTHQEVFRFQDQRILQVLPTLGSGGVEKTTVEICEALLNVGSIPYVAAQEGKLLKELRGRGVIWIPGSFATKNPFKIIRNAFKLAREIKRHHITLVHARSRAPAWSAYGATALARVPFVTTFHGTYNGTTGLKKYYNAIMTKGRLVIANSRFIQSHMRSFYKVSEARIRVIPRGVDPECFDPVSFKGLKTKKPFFEQWGFHPGDCRPCLILPGRLTPWKGQEFFIQALRGLNSEEFRAVIIGDSQGRESYKAALKNKIEQFGLCGTIKIVPPSAQMDQVLIHGDAVISASLDPEAFGRVMVEALAMEVPVIAPAHGGSLEIVDHGVTGLLFSPKSIDSFQEQLRAFFKMSLAERKKMGKRGRERVLRDFTTEALCRKTLAVYEELLKKIGHHA